MRQPDLFGVPVKAERDPSSLRAPFPYFGGKSGLAPLVWYAFGDVKQYIEPFAGSLAVLLACPKPASLEVAGDQNLHIANFWRAVKCQPEAVWSWSDYPVSHIDLAARHRWLTEASRRALLVEQLADADWPGDAKAAGWWVWGQCCWIGSGWCERAPRDEGKIPHVSDAGMGLQAHGKIPHVGNAGRGLQAHGQIPHVGNAGRGLQAHGQIPHVGNAGRGLSPWQEAARSWIFALSRRLERVRLVHGDWTRCLNHHYGAEGTALFFDPPYRAYEALYGAAAVADAVRAWCRDNAGLRIALCGHAGDYDLPEWQAVPWDRGRKTYNGGETTARECVWFSPACRRVK